MSVMLLFSRTKNFQQFPSIRARNKTLFAFNFHCIQQCRFCTKYFQFSVTVFTLPKRIYRHFVSSKLWFLELSICIYGSISKVVFNGTSQCVLKPVLTIRISVEIEMTLVKAGVTSQAPVWSLLYIIQVYLCSRILWRNLKCSLSNFNLL